MSQIIRQNVRQFAKDSSMGNSLYIMEKALDRGHASKSNLNGDLLNPGDEYGGTTEGVVVVRSKDRNGPELL